MATKASGSATRLLIVPAVILLWGWILMPLIMTLWFSLTKYIPNRGDDTTIPPNDQSWVSINRTAIGSKTRPIVWLEQSNIYGDLIENSYFVESFANWLNIIKNNSVEVALQKYFKVDGGTHSDA